MHRQTTPARDTDYSKIVRRFVGGAFVWISDARSFCAYGIDREAVRQDNSDKTNPTRQISACRVYASKPILLRKIGQRGSLCRFLKSGRVLTIGIPASYSSADISSHSKALSLLLR